MQAVAYGAVPQGALASVGTDTFLLMVNQLRDVRFSRKAIGFLFTFLDYEDEKLRRIAEETALELKHTRNGFRELIAILKQYNYPVFRRKADYYLGK